MNTYKYVNVKEMSKLNNREVYNYDCNEKIENINTVIMIIVMIVMTAIHCIHQTLN